MRYTVRGELHGRSLGDLVATTIEQLGGALRGRRLREVAVVVLRKHYAPGAKVHYRQCYALVASEGIAVARKEPLATFLSQVSRADDVEAAGRRTGRYRLRAAA
jgi:hypothetical protein